MAAKIVNRLRQAILENKLQDLGNSSQMVKVCNAYRESPGPLHTAASCEAFAAAKQLLDQGFDPNVTSPQGTTPLHTAARCNAEAVAGLLVNGGAHRGAVDAASFTPLMMAAELGHSGIVELLLRADDDMTANLEQRDCQGNSALHLAAEGDHLDIVNLLVTCSANVWALNDRGETPLQVAERNGCQRVCQYLGEKLAGRDWRENLELQLPSDNDLVLSVLQDLLSNLRAASLEKLARRTQDGKTLLHWAAVRDATECAKHLLGCDIRADAQDKSGSSALHFAALNGADRVCDLLLRAGADVNLQEARGLTPLMLCMVAGSEAVAERLMRTGRVQLDVADCEGETALMHAARAGNETLAQLVVGESKVLLKNRSGLSALEISELHGQHKLSELLETYRPSVDAYPRQRPKSGYCLVINQMYTPVDSTDSRQRQLRVRSGSQEDVKRIYDVFPSIGFRVHERHDLSSAGIIDQMRKIGDQMSTVDYFVCFILAHGQGDAVFGTDCQLVKIADIALQVDAENCRDLVGKPKIFFIQACRSPTNSEVKYWSDPRQQARTQPLEVAKYIDFFFGFSTWEGYASYRNREGSIYIQKLCDVIEENHAKMDLLKMMTRVCHKVGSTEVPGKKYCYMVPNIKSLLQKDVKF